MSADVRGGLINGDLIPLGAAGPASSESARVACAVARFAVKDGVAEASRIVVETPGGVIVGSGRIDLRREAIAMRFTPRATSADFDRLATAAFDVAGPLADPVVQPEVPPAPANTGIAALAANGAVIGTIAAVAGKRPAADLLVDAEPAASCSSGAVAPRLPRNAAVPAVSMPSSDDVGVGAGETLDGIGTARLTPLAGAATSDGNIADKGTVIVP